jgi:exosortase A
MADGGLAVSDSTLGAALGRWRPSLLALGLGLLVFALIFAEEGVSAVQIWNINAAYNHCWLVLPIAAWLAWVRRDRLAPLTPRPMPLAALLMLPPGLAWLVAERLGIMEGRQLTALAMLWVLVLSVLGWRVCRAMAAPLAYLIFLVPFGAFATPLLQDVTAWMIEVGLRAWGITHYRDGLLIETTAGLFHVAEACAGLRFLIAALAFGALYAFTLFRSPGRRILVMVLALTVPVVANGIRALGIVIAAEYLGSAEAAAADHVIYGWGFFSAIILLLILAGLPFREDTPQPRPARFDTFSPPSPSPPSPDTLRGAPAFLGAAALALVLAGAAPVAAAALDASVVTPRETPARLAVPEGCEAGPDAATLRCPGEVVVSARLIVFSPRVTWRAVAAERWRALGIGGDTDVVITVALPPGSALWRAQQTDEAILATAVWLDGQPAGGGLRSRLAQARNSLGGEGGVPVLAVLELRQPGAAHPARDRALLERILAEQEGRDGLAVQAARLSGWR